MSSRRAQGQNNFLLPYSLVAPFRTNLRLQRGVAVDLGYLNTLAFLSFFNLVGAPFRTPFKIWEWFRYNRLVSSMEIKRAPVFIIGHWRSGTSHLHNIMANDDRYGYVSQFQTMAQDLFLSGRHILKPILAKMFPSTRVADNVEFSLDAPEEEEQAMARISRFSFYRQWSYPQMARIWFHHYVLFDDVKPLVVKRWKRVYMRILRKATIAARNRPLMLKNPVNTARIDRILELFPDAKFIHIYRNPYRVFQSTESLYKKNFSIIQLQKISNTELRSNILYFYENMMKKYLRDREMIPKDRIVEVRFEDLDENPMAQIERIYAHLNLPDFSYVKPKVESYLASLKRYKKNTYNFDSELVELVNDAWGFAFDEFGYDRL